MNLSGGIPLFRADAAKGPEMSAIVYTGGEWPVSGALIAYQKRSG